MHDADLKMKLVDGC